MRSMVMFRTMHSLFKMVKSLILKLITIRGDNKYGIQGKLKIVLKKI